MASYAAEFATQANLQFYPKASSFNGKGSAIGVLNGYLTAVGEMKVGNNAAIALLIRFNRAADAATLREGILASPGVLLAIGEKKWNKAHEAQLTVGADFLSFQWTYSFKKPKAERVLALQQALVEAIRPFAAAHDQHCDICGSAKVPEVMLYNGVPGFYCANCQLQRKSETEQEATAYEARETNLFVGLLFGVAAAVAGSLAWGFVAYGLNRIFLWGGVLIGLMIAKALFAGMGKVNRIGQVAVFVLTFASVIFGDVIFYTLSVMKSEALPFSFALMRAVISHIVEIESQGDGIISVLFALFGAGYVVWTAARKPKFHAEFERLESDTTNSFGAAAGR